jgi:hypothetical protein
LRAGSYNNSKQLRSFLFCAITTTGTIPIVAEILDSHGLQVLGNQSVPLERNRQRIWIVGVDDVYEDANDLDKALQGVPPTETKT